MSSKLTNTVQKIEIKTSYMTLHE